MIQMAHIGVGISGEEGLQAVNASDYAVAQFRFLKPLLLVHGRWSLRRVAKVTCYIFYKNAVLVLPQFFFGFFAVFSGQNIYYDGLYQLFNVVFTAFPIIVFGIFDKDVEKEILLKQPHLYKDGIQQKFFSRKIFMIWMFEAYLHAAILTLFSAAIFTWSAEAPGGQNIGLWDMGCIVNFWVVLVCAIRLCADVSNWTALYVGISSVSVALWWIVLAVFSSWLAVASQVYGVVGIMVQMPHFWFGTVLISWTCLMSSFTGKAGVAMLFPEASRIYREAAKFGVTNDELLETTQSVSNPQDSKVRV